MKPHERLLFAVALLLMMGASVYFLKYTFYQDSHPTSQLSDSKAAGGEQSKIQYPVASDEKGDSSNSNREKLNLAYDSNQTIDTSLSEMIGNDLFNSIFNAEDFARRFVVTVDSATNLAQLSPERSLVKPLESDFVPSGKGAQLSISAENFRRYAPLIELVGAIDPEKLVALYVHFYPSLQSAYHELGTDKYFNDRLVEVIDHILGTPKVVGHPRLVRPSSHNKYKFMDVDLENLSASQKVLIRMGDNNAQIIMAKLRQIRKLLAHLGKRNLK